MNTINKYYKLCCLVTHHTAAIFRIMLEFKKILAGFLSGFWPRGAKCDIMGEWGGGAK